MKIARLISFPLVLVMTLSILCIPGVVLAQNETQPTADNTTIPTPSPVVLPQNEGLPAEPAPPADNITLSTQFPKIDAIATGTFQFNVDLNYKSSKDRVLDLNVTAPQGWDAFITPQYDTSKRISSISMKGSYSGTSETLQVTVTPQSWPMPDPGEYKINLQAVSDSVAGSIDLIAKITAKYLLSASPANQYYNMTAKAGQDNTFSVKVTNTGTATIENITFSSDKPEGWEVTPKPDKIDLLETLVEKSVDFNIKPPPKTVAGDYVITLTISGKQASADRMSIRVTVETPTIWGWVGVIIILIVVVGLIAIFMRFGRR
jgi:uncharacterized repeat protein (TIGR01451 family)